MFTNYFKIHQFSWKACAILVGVPLSTGVLVYYLLLKKDDEVGNFMRSDYSSAEISVPVDKVGAIIGKEGSVIRAIERNCNVTLKLKNIDATSSNADEFRILIVRGRRDDIRVAEMNVRKVLACTPPTLTDSITVPKCSLGAIIGKNGDNIREMSRCSGARLKVNNSSSGDFETITIKGKPQSIETAKMLIEDKVKDDFEYRQRISTNAESFSKNKHSFSSGFDSSSLKEAV